MTMRVPFAHRWDVRDGKLARFDMHTDTLLVDRAMHALVMPEALPLPPAIAPADLIALKSQQAGALVLYLIEPFQPPERYRKAGYCSKETSVAP